jgi:hypothetical protein
LEMVLEEKIEISLFIYERNANPLECIGNYGFIGIILVVRAVVYPGP